MCVCVCVCVYIYVCMYIYIYIYIYIMADSCCLQQKPVQHYKVVILHLKINKNEYIL